MKSSSLESLDWLLTENEDIKETQKKIEAALFQSSAALEKGERQYQSIFHDYLLIKNLIDGLVASKQTVSSSPRNETTIFVVYLSSTYQSRIFKYNWRIKNFRLIRETKLVCPPILLFIEILKRENYGFSIELPKNIFGEFNQINVSILAQSPRKAEVYVSQRHLKSYVKQLVSIEQN